MWKFLIFGVVVVLAIIGVIYLLPQYTSTKPTPSSLTPTDETEKQLTLDVNQQLLTTLKAGGSSYKDPKGIYTILYPSDYKFDTQNEGQYSRIYKTGPTQKGQTEMYDGVIISIESIDLGTESLDNFVNKRLSEATADGTSVVEEPKQQIILNTYPGYTYSTRGLGTTKHIVLQKGSDSKFAIDITTLVSDPTNTGFQKEVDTIISTIEFQK
jgi:hypothetical protein